MSTTFRPNRFTARIAACLGAVVVALGLAGAQLGLADHYASQAEPTALAAGTDDREGVAQHEHDDRMRATCGGNRSGLAAVKRSHDPAKFARVDPNIAIA